MAEAIYGYTVGAARAVGWEAPQRRIAPGYLAAPIVLDGDRLAIEPEAIPDTRIELLLFDGELVRGG